MPRRWHVDVKLNSTAAAVLRDERDRAIKAEGVAGDAKEQADCRQRNPGRRFPG
jgi:hypothetical protein